MTEKPRRLGRGLGALISGAESAPPATETPVAAPDSPLKEIPVNQVHPNPLQPRKDFKPEELAELEASLKTAGLLQPISVRQRPDGQYELIAGERRLRAATRLGWTTIPALVKPLDNRDMLVLALVENLQRADLNPLDEAAGYQRLIGEFAFTQQQVADSVGKDRSTVTNLLRILSLPEGVQRLVRDGHISLGHARALLAISDERIMLATARKTVEEQLSVRDVERIAQAQRQTQKAPAVSRDSNPSTKRSRSDDAELRRMSDLLRKRLQTDVKLHAEAEGASLRGSINIQFYNHDDLERLIELILGKSLDHA